MNFDTVHDLVIDAGALGTAIMAIGAVVIAVQRWTLRRIERLVREATEPLRKNGGGNVGDLPQKFDDLAKRVELIEQRQIVIKAAVIELGHYQKVPRHGSPHKGPLPGESPP